MGDGKEIGITLKYKVQDHPKGIAEAFIIGEEFIGRDKVCLILGDNIFYGSELTVEGLKTKMAEINSHEVDACIFAYQVSDPERYGVVEFDKNGLALSIEEKPKNPRSHWAVTGFYIYDNDVVEISKNLKPSDRGELEITDVNKVYLDRQKLGIIKLGRGFAWLDAGTPDSLLDSAQFIQTIEKRQGLKIACLEELAFQNGFITREELNKLAQKYKPNSDYRKYLDRIE